MLRKIIRILEVHTIGLDGEIRCETVGVEPAIRKGVSP